MWPEKNNHVIDPVASLGGCGGRIAPGDTLQGVKWKERRKKIVGKFTKNSGETRSDR